MNKFLIKNCIKSDFFDKTFKIISLLSATLIILLLGSFLLQLLVLGADSIKTFGFGFLISKDWDPVKNIYGALPAICGTFITTILSLAIAIPLSFCIAIYLVEIAPKTVSSVLSVTINMLAAIPSIIYGIWGIFVVAPLMQQKIIPFINQAINFLIANVINKISTLCGGSELQFIDTQVNSGCNLLTASLILSIMILPFICAIMQDIFRLVSPLVKEAAYGSGATTFEVSRKITLRSGLNGVVGACFLGLGRAVGETMAVLYVVGNVQQVSASLYEGGTTISATLANNFAEASGLFKSSLFELGFILLVMTFIIQLISKLFVKYVIKTM
ncbi:phosphate ABC transporter permease subunit PstC [Lentisphaerota bacterium WC36G]|nr:phosphate ABC transporter permease subunit PstC [Lentisphaerae bacterium WC36]